MTAPHPIALVPNQSMGAIRLGAKVSELPSGAQLSFPGGELDGIRFLVDEQQRVQDIWIDDLRTFKQEVTYQGKRLPHDASLADLEPILGKITPVEGVKGGLFFNCESGFALGTDYDKVTLQIRVKHR